MAVGVYAAFDVLVILVGCLGFFLLASFSSHLNLALQIQLFYWGLGFF